MGINEISTPMSLRKQPFFKPEKCKFQQTQVLYLSIVIKEGKIQMESAKVTGILE